MAEDECIHGLDPAWCTFCRQKAEGVLPPGVRRPRPPAAPRARATKTTTRTTAGAATRSTPGSARAAPASRGPVDDLTKVRKVLFHATAYGAWPSIAESGLLPTAHLMAGDPRLQTARNASIVLKDQAGNDITIRDQRSMVRSNIESHLDGIDLEEWLRILSERVFLFARQKDLITLLGRYQEAEGQDVLVFDTARLLAAARGRTEVATVASTAPVAWEHCRCRGRDTFEPIDSFAGDIADIQEVTIVGPVEHVPDLVVRVMRHHPDRTTEVLVA